MRAVAVGQAGNWSLDLRSKVSAPPPGNKVLEGCGDNLRGKISESDPRNSQCYKPLSLASSDSVHLVQGALGPNLPRAQCQSMFPNPRSLSWAQHYRPLLAGPGLSYDTPRQDFQVNQLLMARDLVTSLLLRIIAPCL